MFDANEWVQTIQPNRNFTALCKELMSVFYSHRLREVYQTGVGLNGYKRAHRRRSFWVTCYYPKKKLFNIVKCVKMHERGIKWYENYALRYEHKHRFFFFLGQVCLHCCRDIRSLHHPVRWPPLLSYSRL